MIDDDFEGRRRKWKEARERGKRRETVGKKKSELCLSHCGFFFSVVCANLSLCSLCFSLCCIPMFGCVRSKHACPRVSLLSFNLLTTLSLILICILFVCVSFACWVFALFMLISCLISLCCFLLVSA